MDVPPWPIMFQFLTLKNSMQEHKEPKCDKGVRQEGKELANMELKRDEKLAESAS